MKGATFTYYGDSHENDRTVRLYQNQSGTYTVDIEGMPALTQITADKTKAENIFRGWFEFAQIGGSAFEIDWGDW